jgi:D-glycero-alpha-D-manno-heptose-7-phosphate kinase
MIVSRTPLRMSFVGGGSDLPGYYRRHGGAVLSTSIDQYIYVNVNRKFDDGIRIAYSKTEEVAHIAEVEHRLVRATMEMLSLSSGIEITTIADIPARGTGLGSSSSFTVGLLHALRTYLGMSVDAAELGRASCEVEIDRCGEPIGKQDQFAAAFGGLNLIVFNPDDTVDVQPVTIPQATRDALSSRMLCFYTNKVRSASAILKHQNDQVEADHNKQRALGRMVELAYVLRDELMAGNIEAFGPILHENWELKKSLSDKVSSSDIDACYTAARQAGAQGGKLLGAGAGGFLMFDAPPERHDAIAQALGELRRVNFKLSGTGSEIIFNDRSEMHGHRPG